MTRVSRFPNYCTQQERVALICPMCRAGLEAMQLYKDAKGFQTIWWVCKNTLETKCTFPGEMPADVFWLQRSPEDIELGIIPRPKLEKLPDRLKSQLYPTLFPDTPESSLPSRSGSSLHQNAPEIDTRNASLASDVGSIDSRPASNSNASIVTVEEDASVIALGETASVEHTTGGSDSYTTGTSQSVASAPAGVVPIAADPKQSRKRPASSPPPEIRNNPDFKKILSQYFATLAGEGIDPKHLDQIADKLIEMARNGNSDQEKARNKRLPLISQDEYTDTIFQNVPHVTKDQVAEALKKKGIIERMRLVEEARRSSSGAGLLKLIGLAGSPLPEGNTWRSDMVNQQQTNLKKVAITTKKYIDKRNRKKQAAEEEQQSAPSPAPSELRAPPVMTEGQKAREEQIRLDATRDAVALIQKNVRAIEAKKKQERLEQRRRGEEQLKIMNSIKFTYPIHEEPPLPPAESSSRQRVESFSHSLEGWDPMMMMPPSQDDFLQQDIMSQDHMPPLDEGLMEGFQPQQQQQLYQYQPPEEPHMNNLLIPMEEEDLTGNDLDDLFANIDY